MKKTGAVRLVGSQLVWQRAKSASRQGTGLLSGCHVHAHTYPQWDAEKWVFLLFPNCHRSLEKVTHRWGRKNTRRIKQWWTFWFYWSLLPPRLQLQYSGWSMLHSGSLCEIASEWRLLDCACMSEAKMSGSSTYQCFKWLQLFWMIEFYILRDSQ